MRQLSESEIKNISGGVHAGSTASRMQLKTLVLSYAQSIDFNKQLASINAVEDYVLKNIESS